MSFLITILALGIVIFIHELGHLIAAKVSGVGVYEFAVGMGPKVFSRTHGGTEYTLRAFPLGGFVKLAGMDDDDPDAVDPELMFQNKPIQNRFLTISAGSLMNVLLGFFLFFLIFSFHGIPQSTQDIQKVFPDYPAAKAGVQAGDTVVSLNGNPISDLKKDFLSPVQNSEGAPLLLTVMRNGVARDLSVSAVGGNDGRFVIGIQFASRQEMIGPIQAVSKAFFQTQYVIKQVFRTFALLIKGDVAVKDLAGPGGIFQWASFELKGSFWGFLGFMALISINLGLINLFPFPVLDGGHLVFLIIEAIIRKPLSPKLTGVINQVGAAALIALMCFIIFNDVVSWKERVQFFEGLKSP